MTDDPRVRWRELVEQALYADDVNLELLEMAIREADAAGEEEAAYLLRSAMITSCQGRGRPDLILAYFPWCLARVHQVSPDERDDLLFRYRWAISQTMDYPAVGRPRIEELIADMAQRYAQEGFSQRSVWVLRVLMARYWRDEALAREAIHTYWRFPRDELSDNVDTERKFVALTQLKFWPEKHATRVATMTIDNDIQRCQLKAAVLRPLLRLGQLELAHQQHLEGLRLARGQPLFVDRSFHAQYLAMLGNQREAEEMILSDLDAALRSIEVSEVVDFFFNAAWVLAYSAEDHRARIPTEAPDPDAAPAVTLADWLRRRAAKLAIELDHQNNQGIVKKELLELLNTPPLETS